LWWALRVSPRHLKFPNRVFKCGQTIFRSIDVYEGTIHFAVEPMMSRPSPGKLSCAGFFLLLEFGEQFEDGLLPLLDGCCEVHFSPSAEMPSQDGIRHRVELGLRDVAFFSGRFFERLWQISSPRPCDY
jgi:hypothetical protein